MRMTPDAFYYADSNSQPVGPLTLDEIRRFVAAGVIPPDVLVCEQDGEEWRELNHVTTVPEPSHPSEPAPSTLQAPIAQKEAEAAAKPKAEAAKLLGAYFNHAVCATVAFIVLNFISFGSTTDTGGISTER